MRVSIIGQAAFAEAVFKRVQGDGIEVAGVSAPAPAGGRRDPLWSAATAQGLPAIPTASLKDDAAMAAWKALDADLCIMAFVTDILPDDVFDVPRLGTIQYHPSLLPLHRGSSAINWAIITGRNETGLTIFWPDRGIDTGPILLQKTVPIGPDDTVGSLYFNQLFPMGVEALAEAAALVAAGTAPRIEQDHGRSTYEPPCRDEHVQIPWYMPAEVISRLIRGANPQPGAWTTFASEKLRLFDCRLTGELAPGLPGRVLAIDEESIDIRLNGGVLRVLRVQPAGGKKINAGEWARSVELKPGFRFR